MFRIKASHLPFLILFLFALIFSFYKLDNFYQLNYDQERDYQVVQKILSGDLTLIGPQAVSTAGFYLAPWYYYLLVPFFVLFNGHPLFAAYLTGLVHLLTTLALFLFLKKHTKHDLIALASSLLYASTLHRTAWNVMFIPLLFILFLNLLLRSRQTPKSFSLLLFLVSLGIHFHFQFVLLAPFLGIYLLLNRSKLPSLRSKNLALYFIALLIPLLPLIAFDLRHDFINSRSFLNFFGSALTTSSNLPYLQLLRFSARNIIRETSLYTPLPLNLDYLFLPLAYIGSLIVVLRKKRSLLPLALFPLISLFALSLYSPPTWPEYYHLLAVLSFIVLVSYLIASSPHLIKSLYFIFVLAALVTSLQYLHTYTNSDGYDSRQAVIKYILDSSSPLQPNIRYHFPPGQGLGFTPIRDYLSTQYDLTDQYSNTQFDVFFTSSPPPALPSPTDQVSFGVYTVSLSSIDLASVRYVVAIKRNKSGLDDATGQVDYRIDNQKYHLVFEDKVVAIFENQNRYPYAYISYQPIKLSSDSEVLTNLLNNQYTYPALSTQLVQDYTNQTQPPTLIDSQPNIVGESNFTFTAEEKGLLVVSKPHYPGWKAFLDGKQVPIIYANYLFTGIEVPSGNHTLSLRYQPKSFYIGIIISLGSTLALLFWTIKKSKSENFYIA